MPERRMAKVMRERQRFGEVLIETQRTRERAGDLGDLKRVRESRTIMVAFVIDEDLSLVGQTPESG
jgi:hypothetical protein